MRYYNRYFSSVVNFNNRKQKKIYVFAQKWHGEKQAISVSFFQEKLSNLTSDQIQLGLSRNKILKFNKGGEGGSNKVGIRLVDAGLMWGVVSKGIPHINLIIFTFYIKENIRETTLYIHKTSKEVL